MGILNGIKKQLPKVIEWTDESSDIIVYRFPITDRKEIMNGSSLTVRESQAAIFVAEGRVADVFQPGRYNLSTENMPILTTLFSWKYAFESPYKGEIYFVNTKQFINQKWGTNNPIMVRDRDFGMARIRAFGGFSFRVSNVEKFMKELSGTRSSYKTDDIVEQFKRILITDLTSFIGDSRIGVLDLAANYRSFGSKTRERAAEDFETYGVDLLSVQIENISLPQEAEKAMDQRTSVGMFGDVMPQYMQYQTAQAIPKAAENPNAMGSTGVGLGMGFAMMNSSIGAINSAMSPAYRQPPQDQPYRQPPVESRRPAADTVKCYKCGEYVPASSKFCGNCGATVSAKQKCLSCGTENSQNAKFCSGCGKKLGEVPVCQKCGAQMPDGQKFCPECGTEREA